MKSAKRNSRWNTTVNVDERGYNRSIKRNYSLLPLGLSNSIINDRLIGRTSIIFGLVSNCFWLWINVDKTTKKSDFWSFIMQLKKFLIHCSLIIEEHSNYWLTKQAYIFQKNSDLFEAITILRSILYQHIL